MLSILPVFAHFCYLKMCQLEQKKFRGQHYLSVMISSDFFDWLHRWLSCFLGFFFKVELNFTLFLSTKFNMNKTNHYNWYWKAASFVCSGLLRLKQVLPYLKVDCRTLLHPQNVDSCAPPRHFLDTALESTHCLCNAPRPATYGLSFCQNVPCPMLLPHHYKERRECRKADKRFWKAL